VRQSRTKGDLKFTGRQRVPQLSRESKRSLRVLPSDRFVWSRELTEPMSECELDLYLIDLHKILG